MTPALQAPAGVCPARATMASPATAFPRVMKLQTHVRRTSINAKAVLSVFQPQTCARTHALDASSVASVWRTGQKHLAIHVWYVIQPGAGPRTAQTSTLPADFQQLSVLDRTRAIP